jgi:hypothetical protein
VVLHLVGDCHVLVHHGQQCVALAIAVRRRGTTIQRQHQSSSEGTAVSRGTEERDGDVSPFSFRSLEGTRNSSSLGVEQGEVDDGASDSWSVDVASSSSNQTGQVSLARRAQEFDQLLQSQKRVLTDFDSISLPRPETEDDGLQTELQDLARSEMLLRKELEIFASSFRRNKSDDTDDEQDVDEVSSFQDMDELVHVSQAGSPSLSSESPPLRQQQSPPPLSVYQSHRTSSPPTPTSMSPLSRPMVMSPHIGLAATPGIASTSGLTSASEITTTSPGMAPWSPDDPRSYIHSRYVRGPDVSTGSGHVSPVNSSLSTPQDSVVSGSSSNSRRVSLENEGDLGLPSLDTLRQQRQSLFDSPSVDTLRQQRQSLFDSPSDMTQNESFQSPDMRSDRGLMMLPPGMMASSASAGQRPPLPLGSSSRSRSSTPRVSLDQEVPSLLDDISPAVPTSRPTADLRSVDSDDSVFYDLAQLSSDTPRASNTKEPEYQQRNEVPSSPDTPSPGRPDHPSYPTTPSTNILNDFLSSDTPVTPSVIPAIALYSQTPAESVTGVPGVDPTASHPLSTPAATNKDEPSSSPFVGLPPTRVPPLLSMEEEEEQSSSNELNVSREDQIGLLDDFVGASWKILTIRMHRPSPQEASMRGGYTSSSTRTGATNYSKETKKVEANFFWDLECWNSIAPSSQQRYIRV